MFGLIAAFAALAFFIFYLSGVWKAFEKAGEPGWACIVPIYNWMVLFRMGGRSEWWVLSFLFPPLFIIMAIITMVDIARNFGQSVGFGLGLAFLGVIFWPILGHGHYYFEPLEGDYYDDRIDEFGSADDYEREDDSWNPMEDRRNV